MTCDWSSDDGCFSVNLTIHTVFYFYPNLISNVYFISVSLELFLESVESVVYTCTIVLCGNLQVCEILLRWECPWGLPYLSSKADWFCARQVDNHTRRKTCKWGKKADSHETVRCHTFSVIVWINLNFVALAGFHIENVKRGKAVLGGVFTRCLYAWSHLILAC